MTEIPTLTFQGNAVTALGAIGLVSTLVTLVTAWRSHWVTEVAYQRSSR